MTATQTLHLLDNIGIAGPRRPELTLEQALTNLRAFNIHEAVTLTTGCNQCDLGCGCQGGTPGCEHFGCWGTTPTGACIWAAQHRAAWRRIYPNQFED